MIYAVLGIVLLAIPMPLLVAITLSFINGWDQFWRFLLYGFVSIAILFGAVGMIALGIKLISMGG